MADFFDPIISAQVQDYLANQKATADQAVQDPYAPGLTLNEIDGGYLTPPEAPQLPSPTTALNTLPEGSSEGMSMSRRGVNKEALAADMQGGEAARVERQIFNDSAAEGEAAYDPLLRQMGRTQAAANQAAQDVGEAASNEALAAARSFDEQARYIDRNYNQAILDNERSEQRKAQSEASLRRAKYYQAEDAFARMSVKPKDFQLELGLSMAVDSWLALWGVKTNNTSAVLEQIRNDINVQMENMQHGREVANGFKMAYDLASQNATSKKEAADQIEAMLFKSMSYKLEADKARAKSTTELANIKAKQAEIDGHYLELQTSIEGAMDQDIAKRRDDRIQLYNINVQKHLEELRLSAQRAAAQAARGPKPISREDAAETTIYVGGLPYGRARSKTEAPKVQAELDNIQSTTGEVRELIGLVKQVGLKAPKNMDKIGEFIAGESTNLNFLASDEDRSALQRAKALYEYVSGNYRRSVSGQAVSEGEMKRFEKVLQIPSIVNKSGADTLYQFNDLIIQRARRALGNSIYELTPEERAAAPIGVGARGEGGFPTDAAGAEAGAFKTGTPKPAAPTRIEAISKKAQSEPDSYVKPSKHWPGFVAGYQGAYGWTEDKMPDTAAEVDHLTQIIRDGSVKKASEEKKAEKGEAEAQLQEIARGESVTAAYAQYVIKKDYQYLLTQPRRVSAKEAAAEAARVKKGSAEAQDAAALKQVTSPEYFQGSPSKAKAQRDADEAALYEDMVRGYGRLK